MNVSVSKCMRVNVPVCVHAFADVHVSECVDTCVRKGTAKEILIPGCSSSVCTPQKCL